MRITNFLLFSALFAISSRSYGTDTAPSSLNIEETLAKMTVEQKVGQLLMIGFTGYSVSPQLKEHLQSIRAGNIIIFGQNIKTALQISQLNHQLQQVAKISTGVPYLMAVDQEGGPVVRVKTPHPLPSARAVGQTGDVNLAREAGLRTGELLRVLGFNMNLAPVLDLGERHTQNFIGVRAFSADPQIVKHMGEAFSDGLREANVLPTAKHFPGHGGGLVADSHFRAVEKRDSLDILFQRDLVPFGSFARSPLTAIMMAHVNYSGIDNEAVPATFSRKIVTGLLREQLNFQGLVISDDIEMAGAKVGESVEERAMRAILAGVDIVMVAWNKKSQALAYRGLIQGVQNGKISIERLNMSVRRVLQLKSKYAYPIAPPATVSQLTAALGDKELSEVSDRVAWKNYQRERVKITSALESRRDRHDPKFGEIKIISSHFIPSSQLKAKNTHITSESPRTISATKLSQWLTTQSDRLVVIIVSGKQTERIASVIDARVRNRVLVVHAEKGIQYLGQKDYFGVLDMWSYHPALNSWLIGTLTSPLEPTMARHLDDEHSNQ